LSRARSTARPTQAASGSERAHPDKVHDVTKADPDRVKAVRATGLLDSDATPDFDLLARLAAQVLNAPVALVSLVDADREFFKSCLGLPEPWASQWEAPLTHSICPHTVASGERLLVYDADGHAVGTLCVIDSRPRQWTSHRVRCSRTSPPRS
jgi:GAF domain-containing protein